MIQLDWEHVYPPLQCSERQWTHTSWTANERTLEHPWLLYKTTLRSNQPFYDGEGVGGCVHVLQFILITATVLFLLMVSLMTSGRNPFQPMGLMSVRYSRESRWSSSGKVSDATRLTARSALVVCRSMLRGRAQQAYQWMDGSMRAPWPVGLSCLCETCPVTKLVKQLWGVCAGVYVGVLWDNDGSVTMLGWEMRKSASFVLVASFAAWLPC